MLKNSLLVKGPAGEVAETPAEGGRRRNEGKRSGSVSTYQVGSGITAETRKTIGMELFGSAELSELRKILEELPDQLNRPWGTKAPLIAALRGHLARIQSDAPAPSDFQAWRSHFIERQSEGWFVLTAVKYANLAEKCIEQGRGWEAVSLSMDIGRLVTELAYKMDLERAALAGQTLLESQGKGAKARRKHSPEVRHAAVMEFRDRGLSVPNSIQRAAEKLQCSAGAVRRDYYTVKNHSNPTRVE